jgi:hypothetical protein
MLEVAWTELFAHDLGGPQEVETVKKCKCGNGNCKRAKHIKCVCGCHAENHGIEQRRGMEPLDKALGFERPKVELIPWFDVC